MVDYVKFKNSTPASSKQKKYNGSRYKDYLFGSIESMDMEWADKIVDFNPDLKMDTNPFTKYVDRNTSMSTDCGLDFSSSLNSNSDKEPCLSDLANGVNTGFDSKPTQNKAHFDFSSVQNKTNTFHQKSNQSPTSTNSFSQTPTNKNKDRVYLSPSQYKKFQEIQTKYDELASDFAKLKQEHEANLKDAESFRACKEKLNTPKQELGSDMDSSEKLELLLDHIYAIMSDSFGSDNTLVFYLEKFADLYVNYQNQVKLELASLRSKSEVVDNLDKLVSDKAKYDKLLEQKDNTIESLVEELKNLKAEDTLELNKLKEELENATDELNKMVQENSKMQEDHRSQLDMLNDALKNSKSEYAKLLLDQNQILSQLPLLSLEVSINGKSNMEHTQELLDSLSNFKPDFSKSNSDLPFWPASDPNNSLGLSDFSNNTSKSKGFDNFKFLQSMVQSLHKKHEEAVEVISQKDAIIREQQDKICKLQNSVKEWESDAVLWLDYVDQSSSVLNLVN
ncbi:hypothetical protein TpMuguga_02g00250 [Theileria parva strain Muguga]|uniref:Uncharacterized protein n=1 Tax=Theileria parva TaxID=5875 RepID=Q4N5P0_THEPA|nr:uncharacterized protein TpMuguga_02g00250 [Theileria parva strain Muguga]EAN32533.1 hypothetical protein TpMuguga_02g00250 [Theileria parva strain Muguga]|eukprot:XP_764816.1 hypothetical protein [Theileria parva strain Muguga]